MFDVVIIYTAFVCLFVCVQLNSKLSYVILYLSVLGKIWKILKVDHAEKMKHFNNSSKKLEEFLNDYKVSKD